VWKLLHIMVPGHNGNNPCPAIADPNVHCPASSRVASYHFETGNGRGNPYSITERSKIKDPPLSSLYLTTMSIEEPETPVRIGTGSFAVVYVISGGLIAFKEVSHTDNSEELHREYNTLCDVYLRCNTDFFAIPRAFAFSNPLTGDFSTTAPNPPSVTWPRRTTRPLVTPDLGACFQQPTYAMDRVHALPITVRRHLAKHYFPPNVSRGPALCRLYLGRNYTGAAPSRFFNTNNFPLDETRYTQLATLFEFLPPAADVARAMGDMLFRLHHLASVDARDIEFVLGGDGGAGFTFFIIDFNQAGLVVNSFCAFQFTTSQVRPWDRRPESIDQLVSAFFANDPYYPRPRASDPLYNDFKAGYLGSCGRENQALVVAFFDAIELTQAERDSGRAQDS